MKIYLSGKITGDPGYREKFAAAAEQLTEAGHIVLNPATQPPGLRNADYMRMCFAMMEAADLVVFLPSWTESSGALLEMMWCRYVGKPTALDLGRVCKSGRVTK